MPEERLQAREGSRHVKSAVLLVQGDGQNIQTGQPHPQQLALLKIILADVPIIHALLEAILSLVIFLPRPALILVILLPDWDGVMAAVPILALPLSHL